MGKASRITRRRFIAATAAGAGMAFAGAGRAPNDRVSVGLIGCGRRGMALLEDLAARQKTGELEVAGVCDLYAPHRARAAELAGARAFAHWTDLLAMPGLDAVAVATPDHWHAAMAIAAMRAGKDVYLEAPMALHTAESAEVCRAADETGRVVQVGAQRASEAQWRRLRGLIEEGRLGAVRYLQFDIPLAPPSQPGPALRRNEIDWRAFVGPAPDTAFDVRRFWSWRDYPDYTLGPAAFHHYQAFAGVLTALGEACPHETGAFGGTFAAPDRETLDSLAATAVFPSGAAVNVVTSGPGRGEAPWPALRTERADVECRGWVLDLRAVPGEEAAFRRAFGRAPEKKLLPGLRPGHLDNWLQCIRTRDRCVCPPELGHRALAAVEMAVRACREAKTFRYDEATGAIGPAPPRHPWPSA